MPPPDKSAVVTALAASLPIFQTNSMLFTDAVAAALAAQDPNWGRKVRRAGDWESRNADALAYRMGSDDAKHYVDIVVNSVMPSDPDPKPVPSPAWQVYEGPNVGNGFWMAVPGSVEQPPIEEPPATDPTLDDFKRRVLRLEVALATLSDKLALFVTDTARRLGEIEALAQHALVVGRNASEDVGKLNTRTQVIENALAQPVRTSQSVYHSHAVTILPKK